MDRKLKLFKIENTSKKLVNFRSAQIHNIGTDGEGEKATYYTGNSDVLTLPLGESEVFGFPDLNEWEELIIDATNTVVQLHAYGGTLQNV